MDGEVSTTDVLRLRVHHVALDVDDLDRALTFYCDGLGLSIAARPPALGTNGAWLDIGDGRQIHLVASKSFTAPETAQHLALQVGDCDEAVAELRRRGIDIGDVFDIGAGRQAFLRDPAGNLLELNQPSPA